ncbi:MAG: glycine cleavage system protein GcvH [Rhodospirillales bacterium]|nr:glycine cleavage system protein GcvH [Rhodospirillales bacterium]
MSETRFTRDHEWVRLDDGIATVGITDHAQAQLGDIVFVDLPAPGREVAAGEACAVVESVKAASDVFAPLAGHITEVNAALTDDPALVNREPQGEGWFFRMSLADAAAFAALLDAEAYAKLVEGA